MPSASAKIEKVVPSEGTDPVKQVVNLLEKKMRNLEKRKIKLDNYRSDVENGKELNEDQKVAVSKYESVLALLDFTKDFCKSMNTIVLDSIRQQKKQAKKEQLERQQHEIQRLQEAFIYCHILSCFQNEDVRNDFLNGENGGIQLSSEQLSQLDQLYKLIGPGLPNEQADLANHFHVLAENHIFLVEGKNKEIAGTTYKVLKELLLSIKECGYFSKPSDSLDDGISSDEMPEETEILPEEQEHLKPCIDPAEEVEDVESPIEEQFEVIETASEFSNSAAVQEEAPTDSAPTGQNGPLQEVLAQQSSFNFLQESQIDLDAPHMDPAVVAVHQMAPPPTANFTVTPYPSSPPTDKICTPLINGNDPLDTPALVSCHQPAAMPRTITPVLSSVQHSVPLDFDPSHPIPTQTFTNQSFAVMQNMMIPQTYVPVTMHHAPHMAPIAVVPGSPIASAPILHVPITTVPLQDGVTSNTFEGKPEMDEIEMNGENTIAIDSNEKGNEGNGYPQHRGGYRGRGRGRGNNGYFRGRANYHNGRGGYQNHYYQDRNGYNNYRRGNNRGPRGNGNTRGGGRGNFNRTQQQQPPQQQQQQPPPQQQQTTTQQ